MVSELRIYFEGDRRLRPGFHEFFKEIREVAFARRCYVKLVDTDGTPVADFLTALKANPDAWNVLLLDSDAPNNTSLSEFLRSKGLERSHQESVFWMVQIMETWFLSDIDSLAKYYGGGFRSDGLRGNPQVEQIPKADVLSRLKGATRDTQSGEYHKTRHAPRLLAMISPSVVRRAAPNCERMFGMILAKLSDT
jgi:hypothetical protein